MGNPSTLTVEERSTNAYPDSVGYALESNKLNQRTLPRGNKMALKKTTQRLIGAAKKRQRLKATSQGRELRRTTAGIFKRRLRARKQERKAEKLKGLPIEFRGGGIWTKK